MLNLPGNANVNQNLFFARQLVGLGNEVLFFGRQFIHLISDYEENKEIIPSLLRSPAAAMLLGIATSYAISKILSSNNNAQQPAGQNVSNSLSGYINTVRATLAPYQNFIQLAIVGCVAYRLGSGRFIK